MIVAESDAAKRHRRLQQQLNALAGHRWQSSGQALRLRREELEEARSRIKRGIRRQKKDPWAAAVDQIRTGGRRRPAAFRWDAPGDGKARKARLLPSGAVQLLPGGASTGAGAGSRMAQEPSEVAGGSRRIQPRFQYHKQWSLGRARGNKGASAGKGTAISSDREEQVLGLSKADVAPAGLFSAAEAKRSSDDDAWRHRISARDEAEQLLGVAFGPLHQDLFPGSGKSLADARQELGPRRTPATSVPSMRLRLADHAQGTSDPGSASASARERITTGGNAVSSGASHGSARASARPLLSYQLQPPPGRRPIRSRRPAGNRALTASHEGTVQGIHGMDLAPSIARSVLGDGTGGVLGLPTEASAPQHPNAMQVYDLQHGANDAAVLHDRSEFLQWQAGSEMHRIAAQHEPEPVAVSPTRRSGLGQASALQGDASSRDRIGVATSWGGPTLRGAYESSASQRTRGILLARDAS